MQYYFLLISLPPLSLGVKPEISFKELREMIELNLSAADLQKVRLLLRSIDLYNMQALWMGQPLDDRGNFSTRDLQEFLLVKDDSLPQYILDFLDRYDDPKDRLRYFSSLYASFYASDEVAHSAGFLRQYYDFEKEMRLTLSAIRAKQMKRDIVKELQFEDPMDPSIAFILAQKDAVDFTPLPEFEDLKMLVLENSAHPEKMHRALLEYRFEKIEQMVDFISFSIDQVLKYIAQFLIVDGWFHLDREKGQIALNELSQYE